MSETMGLTSDGLATRAFHQPVALTSLSSSYLLQIIWADYTSILILALFTVGIWVSPMYYVESRVVPLWLPDSGGSLHDLRAPIQVEYPWRPEPLPSWYCGFVVVTFVVTILKQFVGGFRPHFIEVCKPDMNRAFQEVGKERYWLNATACTAAPYDIKKAMQSFPSGHTANAFAGAMFTCLYLNAQLKVFADHASNIWAMTVTIAPLIGASLISGSMYMSHQHHADDIVFGMMIGVSLGFLSYRSRYTAVLDFRYNHIPLPPPTTYITTSCSPASSRKTGETTAEEDPAKTVDISVWSRQMNQKPAWLRNINRVKSEQ